ncbi:MAG: hypothetical protein IKT32_01690 [Clostridia bacterium]|nr:hypothetical protein [Clostridia bacterium]
MKKWFQNLGIAGKFFCHVIVIVCWLWLTLSIDDNSSASAIILWPSLIILEFLLIIWSITSLIKKALIKPTSLNENNINNKPKIHPHFTQPLYSSRNTYDPIIKSTSSTDNLNYNIYTFTAIHSSTKKKHKNKTIEVFVNENIVDTIKNIGYEEPIEYQKKEFPPPSEAQKNYFRGLTKKELPLNACKFDASALLSRYEDFNDLYSPNPDLIAYATKNRIKFSYYIGKKALYSLIFYDLPLIEKITFFIFCVYKDNCQQKQNIHQINANPENCKYYQLFKNFASENITNEPFIKSLLRLNGSDLRFFGEQVTENNYIIQGGSKNTIAYKTVREFLKNKNLYK